MNKKGFLLPEQVVKIVIALIVLGFLVYFLTELYFSGKDAEDLEKAKGLVTGLDGLKNNIDILTLGENKPFPLVTSIPHGWYVFTFTTSGVRKPRSCETKNCVCVCENIVFNYGDKQAEHCGELGICLVVDKLNTHTPELEVKLTSKNPATLILSKDTVGGISIKKK